MSKHVELEGPSSILSLDDQGAGHFDTIGWPHLAWLLRIHGHGRVVAPPGRGFPLRRGPFLLSHGKCQLSIVVAMAPGGFPAAVAGMGWRVLNLHG